MGRLTLPQSGRIYFDANCFVYSLERISPYDAMLGRVWDAAYAGTVRIVTSQLSLLESTVQPLRKADPGLVADAHVLLESADVELLSIDRRILIKAAELRAATRLKTPDAIHAATAIVARCDTFLTNDRRIRQFADIPVIHLGDLS